MVLLSETEHWLRQGEERLSLLRALTQPVTAAQLAARVKKLTSTVCEHLRQLRVYDVVACLNPTAHRGRVYWLTGIGVDAVCRLFERVQPLEAPKGINWSMYGDLSFPYRRAVLLSMRGRMRPAQVKKQALAGDGRLRMSVDNCREVLYWMRTRGVVRAVRPRGERRKCYELTEVGKACQQLMRQALSPFAP